MQTVEISRTKRHLQPAHYTVKVEKYSLFAEVEEYQSGLFEAGGYKWRLVFYPSGDKENNGENYFSLYLEIAETGTLAVPWEVNVNFKMFVYDQIEDKYLTIQEANGGMKRFHEMKTRWGFSQLLSLETLKDSSNGYIVNDSCVFGVEVFVIKPCGNWESISVSKAPNIDNATFTWEIEKFSKLDKESDLYSEVFSVGERNWQLGIRPEGDCGNKGKAFSVYLFPSKCSTTHPNKAGLHATTKLRVLDQVNGKHIEREVKGYFNTSHEGWGYSNFISLENLHKPSNGFIVRDRVKVEVELVSLTETTYSS